MKISKGNPNYESLLRKLYNKIDYDGNGFITK